MKKIKNWFINRFLPAWAREELLAENRKLAAENWRLKEQVAQLNAYIDGMEAGIRSQRRIVINTGEAKK